MLTAITFPLKRFPGQLKHESIIFTGKVMVQPVILSISLASQMILAYFTGAPLVEAILYSLPLLFSTATHIAYLLRMKGSDSDYFDMGLAELRKRFSEDASYFNSAYNIGVAVSVSIIMSAFAHESVTLLLFSLNSTILFLLQGTSVYMGLYSRKRFASFALSVAALEAVTLWGVITGAHYILYYLTAAITIYYIHERLQEHSYTRLLQKIIK